MVLASILVLAASRPLAALTMGCLFRSWYAWDAAPFDDVPFDTFGFLSSRRYFVDPLTPMLALILRRMTLRRRSPAL